MIPRNFKLSLPCFLNNAWHTASSQHLPFTGFFKVHALSKQSCLIKSIKANQGILDFTNHYHSNFSHWVSCYKINTIMMKELLNHIYSKFCHSPEPICCSRYHWSPSWTLVHSNWSHFHLVPISSAPLHSIISYKKHTSTLTVFDYSVPHGSVLGPLLSTLYTVLLSSLLTKNSHDYNLYTMILNFSVEQFHI